MEDKRIHQRYKVIHYVSHPTQYNLHGKGIPGVLVDLSASGMAINAYNHFPVGTKIDFVINIPGLVTNDIEGHVEWSQQEGEMWHTGVLFTKISQDDRDKIDAIAADYNEEK